MQDFYDRQCLIHGELLEAVPDDDDGLWCRKGHKTSIWAVVRVSDRRVAFLADRYAGAAGTAEVGRWLLKAVLEISSRKARRGLYVRPDGYAYWDGHRLEARTPDERAGSTVTIPYGNRLSFAPLPKTRRSAKGRVLKSKV